MPPRTVDPPRPQQRQAQKERPVHLSGADHNTRTRIVFAVLQAVKRDLVTSYGHADHMAVRERLAALMFQMGLFDVAPEPELEDELRQQGLLLRPYWNAQRLAERAAELEEDDHGA